MDVLGMFQMRHCRAMQHRQVLHVSQQRPSKHHVDINFSKMLCHMHIQAFTNSSRSSRPFISLAKAAVLLQTARSSDKGKCAPWLCGGRRWPAS